LKKLLILIYELASGANKLLDMANHIESLSDASVVIFLYAHVNFVLQNTQMFFLIMVMDT
jgi:hypothetical protein